MKRICLTLEDIAAYNNLMLAFYKAAQAKRFRTDVRAFSNRIDQNLNQLGGDIRRAKLPYGRYRSFEIYDPKQRLIHAACFEDRVFHHALMNLAGSILERAMSPTSYACRPGKGIHQAVKQVQHNLRRFEFYAKIDIDGYFASINHELALLVLRQRFKGMECLTQFQRILASYEASPGYGLPIGSLTSQYFANYFLDGLDRFLSSLSLVRAQVRYMDDIIWWCDSKQAVKETLQLIKQWLHEQRNLQIKPTVQIHHSKQGVTYCGFRVLRGVVRLSRRRKRRFQQRRQYWEQQYIHGVITAQQLQLAYASVHALCSGTDSLEWRKLNLHRHPPLTV